MELKNELLGTQLIKIEKEKNEVKLTFENESNQKRLSFSFTGLLFETSLPVLNRKVKNIKFRDILGIKALTQLRQLGHFEDNYKQLLLEMEGSTDGNKIE